MPNYREIIGRPIKNKIYFCGEAYHHYQPSTIHGAYESAISTAKDLINYDLIQLVWYKIPTNIFFFMLKKLIVIAGSGIAGLTCADILLK